MLVRYNLEDVTVKGAWQSPADIELFRHALAPVAALPVLEVISGLHILMDMTLGLGEVVPDYLEAGQAGAVADSTKAARGSKRLRVMPGGRKFRGVLSHDRWSGDFSRDH